ncbi:SRPBCC family protein [Streptomyces sp. NPDC086766]|uniref:SRPBCC family protein n=1 Tax=Streptomyces sp. NPDC086766 TaxID=3365754 RepID=UPI00381A9BF1
MEHEVFVPVPARRLRAALADPAQVARAVPGLQREAGAEPVAGRLKVRIGGHSITYRGTLRVSARDDGSYAVEGDATESRGTGSVKLALTLRVRDAEGGCVLVFEGTASADGRVEELPEDAVRSAAVRLLNRFAEHLATGNDTGTGTDSGTAASGPGAGTESASAGGTEDLPAEPEPASAFDTEAPPPSLAPSADEGEEEGEAGKTGEAEAGEAGGEAAEEAAPEAAAAPAAEPPAEAAHARRTMIGRSAEEVDHAPPRGRYAPVPAPLTVSSSPALRWAAPAAALVVASAIVLGRALRRRR